MRYDEFHCCKRAPWQRHRGAWSRATLSTLWLQRRCQEADDPSSVAEMEPRRRQVSPVPPGGEADKPREWRQAEAMERDGTRDCMHAAGTGLRVSVEAEEQRAIIRAG